MGTDAARKMETVLSPTSAKFAKKAGSSASRGEDAPKPDKVTACLATRLHNFPGLNSFLPKRHLFIVPPGEVASPLFFVGGAGGSHAFAGVLSEGAPRMHTSVPRPVLAIAADDVASTSGLWCAGLSRGAVFPECATARKQAAFKRLAFRSAAMFTRYDWLTKLRTARLTRLSINH